MRILCPACKTENASDATICTQCAAALPAPLPALQRLSLLEQAMAKPAAVPLGKPVAKAAPEQPPPAPQATAKPASTPTPVAAPGIAKPLFTMPPLPPAPRARRRRRAPWILAALLLLALVAALAFAQWQARGLSGSSLITTRP